MEMNECTGSSKNDNFALNTTSLLPPSLLCIACSVALHGYNRHNMFLSVCARALNFHGSNSVTEKTRHIETFATTVGRMTFAQTVG